MMKQIIAIGGGGFGRNPGQGIIEKYIINQSEEERPKASHVYPWKSHVYRTNLQWNDIVSKCRKCRWNNSHKHHDRSMHCSKHII